MALIGSLLTVNVNKFKPTMSESGNLFSPITFYYNLKQDILSEVIVACKIT